jgi:hypothetical protein
MKHMNHIAVAAAKHRPDLQVAVYREQVGSNAAGKKEGKLQELRCALVLFGSLVVVDGSEGLLAV